MLGVKLTTLTKEEILDNHKSALCSFGISTKNEELDLPSLYWIPKLHKCPYKQWYIAGSSKCSTKPLSKLLTSSLSAINAGLQSYCQTAYSRGGVNQMWILKNPKIFLSTYNLTLFHLAIVLKHLTLYTLHKYPTFQRQIKRVGISLFHKKERPT